MKQIGCALALAVIVLSGAAWVLAASEARTEPRFLPPSVAFAPGEAYAFVSGQEAGSISVLSLAENRQSGRFSVDGMVDAIVFHPDGRTAYVLAHEGDSASVHVVDAARRRAVARIPITGCQPTSMAISTDGAALSLAALSGSASCMVTLDIKTRLPRLTFSGAAPYKAFNSVLASDASRIYTAKFALADLNLRHETFAIEARAVRGQVLADFTLGDISPDLLAASADNTMLAISENGGEQAGIRFIDAPGGALSALVATDTRTTISGLDFSADGKELFALAGRELVTIDVQARRALGTIALRSVPKRMLAASPGGKIVVLEDGGDLAQRPLGRVGLVTVIDTRSKSVAASVPLKGSLAHSFWLLADRLAATLPGGGRRHPIILNCP